MKKTIIALSLAAMSLPALAQQKAPEPDFTITGNVGVFSDYRFRGISQTRTSPALQGGFDISHKSGFYIGNWNSNVSSYQYNQGAGLEMDLYGGYKTELAGVGLDFGAIYYYYPGAAMDPDPTTDPAFGSKYNNREIYIGASYGPLSFKVTYELSNYFGLKTETAGFLGANQTGESKGTKYYDLTFSKEVMPKLTLIAHAGMTKYKNYTQLDYKDYRVGVNYDLNGWILGLSAYSNSLKDKANSAGFYTSTSGGSEGNKTLYKSGGVVSLTKTF